MDLVQQAEAGGAAAAEVQRPPQNAEPFRLKGGGFTILIIEPLDIRAQDFFRRLMDRLGQAPNFYRNAPVAVDLQALTDPRPINFAELAHRLRQHRLIPVVVMNATAEQAQAAANAGLALLPAPRPAAMPEPPAPRATSAETKPAASTNAAASAAARTPPPPSSGAKAMVVAEPVRAG